MRVSIMGTGLYAGETAVVESIAGGVIPAADVRTEAGRTRRVRTIDLVPDSERTADRSPEADPRVCRRVGRSPGRSGEQAELSPERKIHDLWGAVCQSRFGHVSGSSWSARASRTATPCTARSSSRTQP